MNSTEKRSAGWLARLVRRIAVWGAWKCGYVLTPAKALETWTHEADEWDTISKQYWRKHHERGQAVGRSEMLRRHVMYHRIWSNQPNSDSATPVA